MSLKNGRAILNFKINWYLMERLKKVERAQPQFPWMGLVDSEGVKEKDLYIEPNLPLKPTKVGFNFVGPNSVNWV